MLMFCSKFLVVKFLFSSQGFLENKGFCYYNFLFIFKELFMSHVPDQVKMEMAARSVSQEFSYRSSDMHMRLDCYPRFNIHSAILDLSHETN